MKTAVIGAGMAGLTAARLLQQSGCEVTVFDKSKGTGGRLASRLTDHGWIDHGAPYLTGDDPAFAAFLNEHGAGGVLQRWRLAMSGQPDHDQQVHFIGTPRNSAVTRALLGDLALQPSTRVGRLESCPAGWRLFRDDGVLLGTWPQVVVAIPAPQARDLVAGQGALAAGLDQVVMEPCWVAVFRTADPLPHLAEVTVSPHEALARITLNGAKPGRDEPNVYVVQATRAWSEACLEDPPAEVGRNLQDFLLTDAAGRFACETLLVHRWRHAFTAVPLGRDCLWDARQRLGLCGDWCLGRRVEDAWRSGRSLAEKMRT